MSTNKIGKVKEIHLINQARALPEAWITRWTLTKNCKKYNWWNSTNNRESDRNMFDTPTY